MPSLRSRTTQRPSGEKAPLWTVMGAAGVIAPAVREMSGHGEPIQAGRRQHMPITPTYPGVYVEELPSVSHSVAPAPTSVTAFVGYTHPLKTAVFAPIPRASVRRAASVKPGALLSDRAL